jgi:Nucleotide modification associated domain 2
VAESFYYFGDKAVSIPVGYQGLIWKRQGCKWKHDPEVVENFLNWLKVNYTTGILGDPKDKDECQNASCLNGETEPNTACS